MTVFTVRRDGLDFIVADAHFGPYSAALVPRSHNWKFASFTAAKVQADRLTKLGGKVETIMIETPDRFEAVQDIVYGAAWVNSR